MILELITPVARKLSEMSDVALELAVAKRADQHRFVALWARDVPLMIPQGTDGEIAALDDPFVWLTVSSIVAPNVALGTAAAVLPLRNPFHLAKTALSFDSMTNVFEVTYWLEQQVGSAKHSLQWIAANVNS